MIRNGKKRFTGFHQFAGAAFLQIETLQKLWRRVLRLPRKANWRRTFRSGAS
jgi:hypothetical protein